MKPFWVSFYSYKGGVGRSLALANLAALLAKRGRRAGPTFAVSPLTISPPAHVGAAGNLPGDSIAFDADGDTILFTM